MDIRSLNTFIQVAESGSFTRAGEKLGYAQPTVSVQIRQLEEELGLRLFDRIGHTIRLTDEGRDVLPQAQRICNLCLEMTLDPRRPKEPHGDIRLAMADSLCPPLLRRSLTRFRERYPHISLKVVTAGTGEMLRLLDHNDADLICTLDSHSYDTNYVIVHEERVGVHFVAAAAHPLARRGEVAVEELLHEPFLLTEKGMSYRRLMDERLARQSLEIRPFLELGRADLICQLVEQGLGLSFLPDYVTEEAVRRGAVVRLPVPAVQPELWKQLLHHRDKWVSPQMRAVIAHFSALSLEPVP